MSPAPVTNSTGGSLAVGPERQVIETVRRLLAPLARICLANGVTHAAAEEILKRAFVQEASALQPDAPAHGSVSRISTATGIRRREVTRLLQTDSAEQPAKMPLATQIFARWTTDPVLRDKNGSPCVLKRHGSAPSFEALASSITRDIHPRSLLDELIRLNIVHYDEESDCVTLAQKEFVPNSDSVQMLGFLADNVGDHFDAAVANVLRNDRQHFEQAVFADELSAESVEALRPLVIAQWQALCDALVPVLTAFTEADAAIGRSPTQRVRVGLYSFSETTLDTATTKGTSGASYIIPKE